MFGKETTLIETAVAMEMDVSNENSAGQGEQQQDAGTAETAPPAVDLQGILIFRFFASHQVSKNSQLHQFWRIAFPLSPGVFLLI
jgi:hypothetical protein